MLFICNIFPPSGEDNSNRHKEQTQFFRSAHPRPATQACGWPLYPNRRKSANRRRTCAMLAVLCGKTRHLLSGTMVSEWELLNEWGSPSVALDRALILGYLKKTIRVIVCQKRCSEKLVIDV